MTGVNVDPLSPAGSPSPESIKAAGFKWVRLVSRDGVESYSEACQAAGLMVLGVVARESNGHVFGGPDVWQFGNEPDSSGPSSWQMSAAAYRDQFNFYQATYPQLIWIAAGLASGQTSYWQTIKNLGGLNGCAGMAIHPYLKTAYPALSLILAYRAITPSMPVWITEWWRPEAEVTEFSAMLRQTSGIVKDCWFAWDGMVAGYGLSGSQERLLAA